MKNLGEYLLLISAIWLGVFAYAKFGPGLPVSSVVTQKTDLFTVSGEGKVTVIPDTATTNIGITISKNSIKQAQAEANTVINKITDELKKLDVEIKTQNYYVYPQYNNNKIDSYQVNISLLVTIKNLDKINQVLDIAVANNANNVGGINLTVNENKQKELQKEARNLAIKEAQEKATELAKLSGMTLGKIVNIQEGTPNRIYPMMAKTSESTQIQSGTTDITSSVTLFYETR